MTRSVSRATVIGALLRKDMVAYSRDLIYVGLTVALLIVLPILFRIMPDSVEESIPLAVSPSFGTMVAEARADPAMQAVSPEQAAVLAQLDVSSEQGLDLVQVDDAARLVGIVEGRLEAWRTDDGSVVIRDPQTQPKPDDATRVDIDVGIVFPEGYIADVMSGQPDVTVTVYSDAGRPPEIRGAMSSFVRELSYELAGRELPVTLPAEEEIIVGEDRAGDQVTMRERMRPLLLFMMLLMETFAMASLVSTEVAQRTVTAILVTPARVSDVLAAKAIVGTILSLGQALIVLALIGGITAQNWSLLLATLLLGAVMFTGVALLVGSAGKDFMGQLFLAMLAVVPLLVPAFAALFPGTAAPWVRGIPTYPIIDVLVGTTLYDATWADSWGSLAYAAGWLVVLFGAGWFTLKRKVESL